MSHQSKCNNLTKEVVLITEIWSFRAVGPESANNCLARCMLLRARFSNESYKLEQLLFGWLRSGFHFGTPESEPISSSGYGREDKSPIFVVFQPPSALHDLSHPFMATPYGILHMPSSRIERSQLAPECSLFTTPLPTLIGQIRLVQHCKCWHTKKLTHAVLSAVFVPDLVR